MNSDLARAVLIVVAASVCTISSHDAHAVRLGADGHGQALIYPYFNARSTAVGSPYATLLTLTNGSPTHKALKVRFFEARRGAEIFDFNLFLAPHDTWVAGVVPGGPGAGIFSPDHSCTLPKLGVRAANPSMFRNGAYAGDQLGDSLDRTYEGFFEILEMGVIDANSALAEAITPVRNVSSPNASAPSCNGLPLTDAFSQLLPPAGGLSGGASLINISDGVDFTYDAVALAQWSDKAQWSAVGAHPNIADTSPAVSYLASSTEGGDFAYVTQWSNGRDAVSAALMAARTQNDFTFEPHLRAATEWIVTMPTKRFYVTPTQVEAPFSSELSGADSYGRYCNPIGELDYPFEVADREGQMATSPVGFGQPPTWVHICGAVVVQRFGMSAMPTTPPAIFGSMNSEVFETAPVYAINGWMNLHTTSLQLSPTPPTPALVPPAAASTRIDLATGSVTTGVSLKYFGLPIVGFATQSYQNAVLPGPTSTVLSNYGANYRHRYQRRVEMQQ